MDHLNELISSRDLKFLDLSISRELDEFIDTLPWQVSDLDWTKIPAHRLIFRNEEVDEKLVEIVRKESLFGTYEFAVAFFSSSRPCVAGSFSTIFSNLDLIFWTTPGPRFVFAAEFNCEKFLPVKKVFLFYKGDDRLLFSC